MILLNLELEEKTDQVFTLSYVDDKTGLPLPMVGFSAVMQIRKGFASDVLFQELSTVNGRVTLGATNGVITITFIPGDSDQTTQLIGWWNATYDLILIDTLSKRKKIAKGYITIVGSSTV